VIAVFVRNQNGVNGFRADADGFEPCTRLTRAESRIYEEARVGGTDESRVAGAAAGENANANDAAGPPL
jgi:hypothetical protein